jgi:hypothetical protein
MDPREAGGFITPSWLAYAEARRASPRPSPTRRTRARRAGRRQPAAPRSRRRRAAPHTGAGCRGAAAAGARVPGRRRSSC